MSELDWDDQYSEPTVFCEAPEEFRECAIDLMAETFGRNTIHGEAFSVFQAWSDGASPRDTFEWWAERRIDNVPLMDCQWWQFMLVIESMSTVLSAREARIEEMTPVEYRAGRQDWRDKAIETASEKEAEFERRLNDLCDSFGLGYRLMDGELVRSGLARAAILKRDAIEAALDEEVEFVIESTWDALNALAQPDYQAAFVGAGTLFDNLWKEFAGRLDRDDIADERKEHAQQLRALLADGYHRTAFPFRRERDAEEVVFWVENAFTMVIHVHRLPEGRAHAEFRERIRTSTHDQNRRIR